MTPEEKAKELFNHYHNLIQRIGGYLEQEILVSILAKQCALIAVDEIIDILEINGFTLQEYHDKGTLEYWIHVKDEIENL
jgi:hypothetical protein